MTRTITNRKKKQQKTGTMVYIFTDLKSVVRPARNKDTTRVQWGQILDNKFRFFFPPSNLIIMKLYNKSVNQLPNVRRCPD